jgi:hypothetical protein
MIIALGDMDVDFVVLLIPEKTSGGGAKQLAPSGNSSARKVA